jgi:uncharacterized repeat protein (TIGR03803 family)
MHLSASRRCLTRSWFVFVALLAGALPAHSTDTYDLSSSTLTASDISFGRFVFMNVVLTTGSIVSGPTGPPANGYFDTFDAGTNQLTVPEAITSNGDYYNTVFTVAQLISVETQSGADIYDGTYLYLPYVQVGLKTYYNVALNVSVADVVKVMGGMPSVPIDQYDAATGQLTIGAVQVGSRIYTNVVLSAGPSKVVSVGGFETILYEFQNGTDGSSPLGGLLMDAGGNLYGTTQFGGSASAGTAFELVSNGSGGYTEKVIYTFQGAADGGGPLSALIMGQSGALYGTASQGGSAGYGTVFELSPNGSGNFTESVLYSFKGGTDGISPGAALIRDANGNLYSTTGGGGAQNSGTVFELAPNGEGGFSESVLYSFQGRPDGAGPTGALLRDLNGNLYGTTTGGGSASAGTVFELKPVGNGNYAESLLYAFTGGADGALPYGSLIVDEGGNLYGTAYNSGDHHNGVVFKLTPIGNGGYTESVLYDFPYFFDGDGPIGSLIMDAAGNLYGTTDSGGIGESGTVFKLAPNGNGGFSEAVLYGFQGAGTDGFYPNTNLIMDSSGNLFGTAQGGGNVGAGIVFEVR